MRDASMRQVLYRVPSPIPTLGGERQVVPSANRRLHVARIRFLLWLGRVYARFFKGPTAQRWGELLTDLQRTDRMITVEAPEGVEEFVPVGFLMADRLSIQGLERAKRNLVRYFEKNRFWIVDTKAIEDAFDAMMHSPYGHAWYNLGSADLRKGPIGHLVERVDMYVTHFTSYPLPTSQLSGRNKLSRS